MRGKAPKKLTSAGELLQAALKHAGYRQADYPLFDLWDNLLGPQSARARAVGVKENRLFVDVDTNIRIHQLTLQKRSLLKKLNGPFGPRGPFGAGPISDIIFRLERAPLSDDNHGKKTQTARPQSGAPKKSQDPR